MSKQVPSAKVLLQRITINPEICHGKPIIRGLRYPVELILELLSAGMTHAEILADYDDLEEQDITAVLAYRDLDLEPSNRTGTTKITPKFDLDPIDWQQSELLARVSPAQRLLTMMAASDFALAGIRGAFRRRYPDIPQSELNMRVLAYVTPIRGIIPQ